MQQTKQLQKLKKKSQMKGVHIRLDEVIRQKARAVAAQQSSAAVRYTETDVYRTAIRLFLDVT